jgi:guanine deaminase
MSQHDDYLQQAIDLACHSVPIGGGPFGAVVVLNGEVIGAGHNRVTLDNDPTAHAEVVAIRAACRTLGDFSLEGATLYASCEPCPMCQSAIAWARIKEVYHAAGGDDAAAAGFDDEQIRHSLCQPDGGMVMGIHAIDHTRRLDPFDLWRNKGDRTDY